jgi:hypothetical protein
MSKEGLEVLARMTDSKIKIRDVVEKWLLLTYDLPHSKAGDKARQEFLIKAAAIGATRHTDSVYLMPWSPEAEMLALELAKTEGGEVIAWAQAEPLNHKEAVTAGYDAALKPIMKEISARLDKMSSYRYDNHQKRVIQMIPKTERLLQNAEAAIARRGSEVLAVWLEILKGRYHQVIGGI